MDSIISGLNSLHFQYVTFFCQVVLFFCLHFTLQTLIYGPLTRARNKRDGTIAERLAQAESLATNARRLKSDYDDQIRSLRQQTQASIHEAQDQAEKEAAASLRKARDEASDLLEAARKQVAVEQSQARAGLDTQARKLGTQIARRIIESTLTAKARDQALARLGGV